RRLHPAGELVGEESLRRGHAVLVLEAVEQDVELEHPDGADDGRRTTGRVAVEDLGGAFLGELLKARIELFAAQRVGDADAGEVFRGEPRDPAELEPAVRREGVSVPKVSPSVAHDNATRPGFLEPGPSSVVQPWA